MSPPKDMDQPSDSCITYSFNTLLSLFPQQVYDFSAFHWHSGMAQGFTNQGHGFNSHPVDQTRYM
jgi:hypothetical protein